MSGRLVLVIVPDAEAAAAQAVIARDCRRYWREPIRAGLERFTCIVQRRYVGRLLAELEKGFGHLPGFSVVVLQSEAILPPLKESAATVRPEALGLPPPSRLEAFFTRERISTDELYDDIEPSLSIRPAYLLTVALSALIAALGMRSGQPAVVIGAMVIAPLLGPTMGMALAATVGDWTLGRRAFTTLAVGSVAGLAVTATLGHFIDIDPTVPELLNRSIVQPADVALALASGAVGVLVFSQGSSLALIGVMIAVSLVPPLAAAGMFFGHGYDALGFNALFVFATNLVCINVAGIAMFLIQGLPPKSWRVTGGVLTVWSAILMILAGLIVGRAALGVASHELVNRLVELLQQR